MTLLLADPNIKVNVRTNFGATALFFAAQQGHVEIVELLLAVRGVNVNFPTEYGTPPLIVAANYGWEKIVKLLLAAPRIDVNARKDDGATALFIAAQFGHAGIVDLLSRHGADVNLPLYQGTTPLVPAIKKGDNEVVRVLLQHPEIRVNQAIDNNITPLFVAAQHGRKDIVRALLRRGADPNLGSNAAIGPLHVACMRGDIAITRILLDRGAESNLHVATTQGDSCRPYFLARLGNQRDILNMLEAHWRGLAARLDALLPGLRPAGQARAHNTQGQAPHQSSEGKSVADEPDQAAPVPALSPFCEPGGERHGVRARQADDGLPGVVACVCRDTRRGELQRVLLPGCGARPATDSGDRPPRGACGLPAGLCGGGTGRCGPHTAHCLRRWGRVSDEQNGILSAAGVSCG